MSMRSLLSHCRTALTSYSDLTDLIPADKITLARRPQRDSMPGITFAIGTVDYDPTFESFAAATSYRIDTTIYGRSADEVTQIHDQVKLALSNVNSSVFTCRVTDERYMVDVDNNHMAEVQSIWLMDTGLLDGSATLISPAFQGYDHMKVKYMYKLKDQETTVADLNEQVYFLDMILTNSGSSIHTFELPLAQENLGKIFTIFTGAQLNSNYRINITKASGSSEHVQNGQAYALQRNYACVSFVALQTSGTQYGWRIWNYHNLHA